MPGKRNAYEYEIFTISAKNMAVYVNGDILTMELQYELLTNSVSTNRAKLPLSVTLATRNLFNHSIPKIIQ